MRRPSLHTLTLVTLFSLVTSGCALFTPSINPDSLYAKLGGEEPTRKLVDTLMVNLMINSRVNSYFMGIAANKGRLVTVKERLFEQICQATGGPCRYSGKGMTEAHKDLNLNQQHFDAFIESFKTSLYICEVDPELKRFLLAEFERLRPEVIR